ncbi:MAG: metallophosphoesterase [Pseudomonadota bacterium]|nr:metallophosphoesterase [Pseudomonadota bacterium]
MTSRLFFTAALVWLPLVIAVPASAQGTPVEVPLPLDADPKIESLLAPLSGVPIILRTGEVLSVEIAAGAAPNPDIVDATLTPSFGQVRPRIALGVPLRTQTAVPSRIWPGRQVDRLDYTLPVDLLPDLYDLEVSVAGFGLLSGLSGTDMQRRAVSIVGEYPQRPRVVVLSDAHAGDVRAVVGVAEDAIARGEFMQVLEFLERSVGNPMNSERWAALARAIREVNLVRPDFVLVTGDLTFLLHPSLLPYEYEDAWRLLDRLEVPAFVASGNHDLYAIDDYLGDTPPLVDGKHLWHHYFGPLYYAVDIGPGLHLAALDTFEWPALDPFPIEDEFDTRAAGQVLVEQRAWLDADLAAYRARTPQGLLVTFAHHDPSWMQRRHAWTGEGRLELREIMASHRVGVHFSGHTHEDRVARYFDGDIVETNGRPHVEGHVVRELHLLKQDGNLDTARSQAELGAILHEPGHGPLFVSTTTVSSELIGDIWGLGGYWGWRLANLVARDDAGGLDPVDFGYPATDPFLAERAERPEHWTAAHAEFGLFSYPSYELGHEVLNGNDGRAETATLRVHSGLLTELTVEPLLTVAANAGQPLEAIGGTISSIRYGDGIADVRVKSTVPAMGEALITVRHASGLPTATPGATPMPSAAPAGDDERRDQGRFGGALEWLSSFLLILAAAARRSRANPGARTGLRCAAVR